MKRTALLLSLLLPLAACNQTPAPSATTPPSAATTASATPSAAAEAAAAAANAAPAAASSVAPAAAASTGTAADAAVPPPAGNGAPLVAGTDYEEIQGGQHFDPLNGKIEVVEVFGYVCPACFRFQPLVNAWEKSLPADVRFTYVPAAFGPEWVPYAHAYYVSQSMGLVAKTHDALFNAIHLDRTLKGERGEDSVQDIAAFYARFGADPQQFASTMSSFAIDGKMRKAKQFMSRVGIEGTPTLVIDGKYRVKGKTREDELRIANQLIAQELAALGAK
jgi:thiol:disulfide interchange protein DsbA